MRMLLYLQTCAVSHPSTALTLLSSLNQLSPTAATALSPPALAKTHTHTVEHGLARAEGYHGFFNHCKLPRKVSYSGVATFVRSESGLRTLASTTSLGDAAFFGSPGTFSGDLELSPARLAALDSEGRVLVTDHGHFFLFNVYAPCIRYGSAAAVLLFGFDGKRVNNNMEGRPSKLRFSAGIIVA